MDELARLDSAIDCLRILRLREHRNFFDHRKAVSGR
jgi:hypothetical protein